MRVIVCIGKGDVVCHMYEEYREPSEPAVEKIDSTTQLKQKIKPGISVENNKICVENNNYYCYIDRSLSGSAFYSSFRYREFLSIYV